MGGNQSTYLDAQFSSDNQMIVSAGYDGSVRVWSVATGGLQLTFAGNPNGVKGHRGPVNSAQFNTDGTRANLSEVGPRFTLKLHKLQLGTLDSKHGEYEFLYKPKDGVNRKKMFM